MEYDEDLAIKYIRNYVPNDIGECYDDDEILNIIDIIWDYYEDNGMLDFSDIDYGDDDVDVSELVSHVEAMVAKDKSAKVAKEHIAEIVKGELAYENSIEEE